MNICINCKNITKNPKFCSRSCAASYNNAIYPKRKKYCKHCNARIYGYRTVCDECLPHRIDWSAITLEQVKGKRSYQKNSRIRSLARQLYQKSEKPQYCINCGYDKYYEVCHIKAISNFSNTDKISEINNLNNLIALCPNCHWEFDKGILKIL